MKTLGFVLVGGQSSRMGRDKARLLIGSQLLVQEVGQTILEVAETVSFIGPPGAYADLGFECLADLRPGLGPLAGLETALISSRTRVPDAFNLVVGCDMPGLQAGWLEQLLIVARASGALCVAAKDTQGKTHPLCAVYRTGCLPFIQEALDADRLRLLDLLAALNAVELPLDAVIPNINTPEQWAAWRSL